MLEFIPNRNDAFQEGVDKEQDIREEIGKAALNIFVERDLLSE